MLAYDLLSLPVWILVMLLTQPFPRWSAFRAEVHRNPRNTARVGSIGLFIWTFGAGVVGVLHFV